MHQPPDLSAQDELQALEVELAGGVAGEMPHRFLPAFVRLARDLARLSKIVALFINVEFDKALQKRRIVLGDLSDGLKSQVASTSGLTSMR